MTDDQRRRVHEVTYGTDDREELAKRIVELEDQVDNLWFCISMAQEDVLSFPRDADGLPIHMGDVLVTTRGGSPDIGEVTSIEYQESSTVVTIAFEYDSHCTDFAKYFRHYKGPERAEEYRPTRNPA
jgi:hypothetical protein